MAEQKKGDVDTHLTDGLFGGRVDNAAEIVDERRVCENVSDLINHIN
jgi:hypothetical protein